MGETGKFSGVEDGMSPAFEKLAEIFEYQVFELCIGEEYLLPYMMNDAVENYLILKNCQMTGDYVNDDTLEVTGKLVVEKDRYVLSVRQGEEKMRSRFIFKRLKSGYSVFSIIGLGIFG